MSIQSEIDRIKAGKADAKAALIERGVDPGDAPIDEYGNQIRAIPTGVTSFNGRGGTVKPHAGDYTAEMVGAIDQTEKGRASGVASLDESGKVPAGQLPEMNYDPAGSAQAVQQALNTHAANKTLHVTDAERKAWNNKAPGTHTHTAAQVGALPISGGTMTGALNMNGKALTNLPTPTNNKDAVPKDYVDAAVSAKSGWTELERITVSKKWTVPSGITRIGVFILGAGAGGDARGGHDFESRDGLYAYGGSCGYVNNVILDVVPGQSFNVVIGSPGVGATSGYNVERSNVTPGGDTKFGTYVAYGGNSPNVPERFYKTQVADSGEGDYPSTSANNGLPTMGVTDNNAICVSPLNCKNFFDVKMSLLSAGGSCSGSSFAQTGANTDLGKGGNARNAGISTSNNNGNFKAGDATGYGNGGGACFAATRAQYKYQPTRTGGKGSQGLVIIYV